MVQVERHQPESPKAQRRAKVAQSGAGREERGDKFGSVRVSRYFIKCECLQESCRKDNYGDLSTQPVTASFMDPALDTHTHIIL